MSLLRRSYWLSGKCFCLITNVPEALSYLDLVFGDFPVRISLSRADHAQQREAATQTAMYRIISQAGRFDVRYPDGQELSFDNTLDTAESVQWHMSQSALAQVGERFALHAAGVVATEATRATLIIGPSGAGKTTLTRELVNRGFSLLSDEAVFVSFTDGTVTGFPRALGISSGTERDGRKKYVRASAMGAAIVSEPVEVDTIILLAEFAWQTELWSVSTAEAIRTFTGQVYASTPADKILFSLIRLVGKSSLFELRAGPPSEAAAMIARLASPSRLAA